MSYKTESRAGAQYYTEGPYAGKKVGTVRGKGGQDDSTPKGGKAQAEPKSDKAAKPDADNQKSVTNLDESLRLLASGNEDDAWEHAKQDPKLDPATTKEEWVAWAQGTDKFKSHSGSDAEAGKDEGGTPDSKPSESDSKPEAKSDEPDSGGKEVDSESDKQDPQSSYQAQLDELAKKGIDVAAYLETVGGTGTARSYNKDGSLAVESEYVGGKNHGSHKVFHDNGQVAKEETYVNGVEHGKSIGYFEDGTKRFEHESNQGEPVGRSVIYNQDGSVLVEKNYPKADTSKPEPKEPIKKSIDQEIDIMSEKLEKAVQDPKDQLMSTVQSLGAEALRAKLPTLEKSEQALLHSVLEELAKGKKAVAMDDAYAAPVIEGDIEDTKLQEEVANDDADEKLVKEAAAKNKHQGDESPEGIEGQVIKSELTIDDLKKSDDLMKTAVSKMCGMGKSKDEIVKACSAKGMDAEKVSSMVDSAMKEHEAIEHGQGETLEKGKVKEAVSDDKDYEKESDDPKVKVEVEVEGSEDPKETTIKKSVLWADEDRLLKSDALGRNHHFSVNAYYDEVLAKSLATEAPSDELLAKSDNAPMDINDILEKGLDTTQDAILVDSMLAANKEAINGKLVKSFDVDNDLGGAPCLGKFLAKSWKTQSRGNEHYYVDGPHAGKKVGSVRGKGGDKPAGKTHAKKPTGMNDAQITRSSAPYGFQKVAALSSEMSKEEFADKHNVDVKHVTTATHPDHGEFHLTHKEYNPYELHKSIEEENDLEKSYKTQKRGNDRFYTEGPHAGKRVGDVRGKGPKLVGEVLHDTNKKRQSEGKPILGSKDPQDVEAKAAESVKVESFKAAGTTFYQATVEYDGAKYKSSEHSSKSKIDGIANNLKAGLKSGSGMVSLEGWRKVSLEKSVLWADEEAKNVDA